MKNFIKLCQEAYYEGKPILSNEEYDAIIARFPDLEDSIGQEGETPHMFRMYSLDKKYPCRGDVLPNDLHNYIKSPKLDGCAVDLLYINGKFTQALTRGDGIKGRDCTANVKQLVPEFLEQGVWPAIMQITGEVCVSTEVPNMRNYASGAVNLKDPKEFAERIKEACLLFVAYNVQCSENYTGIHATYQADMDFLDCDEGFNTVLTKAIQILCGRGDIPTDGEVYRLDYNANFTKAGFTHKFPKGAFAVKEDEAGEWTVIKDIQWQVGGSGKVTPVCIVEEVELEGAKVNRVTLNNLAYMEAMGITHIGQKVRLIRAGGVIPKLVEAEPYDC